MTLDNRKFTESSASARLGRLASAPGPSGDDITLLELLTRIWRGRWIVCATTIAVVAIVAIWMRVSSPLYTATMLVAPAASAGSGGLTGAASRYASLAALAGIDLPSDEIVTPFTEFTETIVSHVVAEQLHRKYKLLPKIFKAGWEWNAEAGEWSPRGGLAATVKGWIRAPFDLPPVAPPTATALATYLKKQLSISTVGTTGMRRIEFQHKDPEFAVRLLQWLHLEGDALIRKKAAARASRQIAYIEQKLRTVTSADHRRSLLQLLLDQEREMMMIQVDLPFAARVISAPAASDNPTFPRVVLLGALGILSGFILGILLTFLIDMFRPPGGRPIESASPDSGEGVADAEVSQQELREASPASPAE